jgi:predicted amidophosphoribosyltransferase
MALINCKECGKDISSTAEKCPGCGASNDSQTMVFVKGICGIAVLVIFSMMVYKNWDYFVGMFTP